MKKTIPTPVRLDPELKSRVRGIADNLGSNSSAIVRLAIIRLLDEIDKTGELRVRTAKEASQ